LISTKINKTQILIHLNVLELNYQSKTHWHHHFEELKQNLKRIDLKKTKEVILHLV